MNLLPRLILLALALALPSCNLANKVLQPPVRLIQAAGRTVTS